MHRFIPSFLLLVAVVATARMRTILTEFTLPDSKAYLGFAPPLVTDADNDGIADQCDRHPANSQCVFIPFRSAFRFLYRMDKYQLRVQARKNTSRRRNLSILEAGIEAYDIARPSK